MFCRNSRAMPRSSIADRHALFRQTRRSSKGGKKQKITSASPHHRRWQFYKSCRSWIWLDLQSTQIHGKIRAQYDTPFSLCVGRFDTEYVNKSIDFRFGGRWFLHSQPGNRSRKLSVISKVALLPWEERRVLICGQNRHYAFQQCTSLARGIISVSIERAAPVCERHILLPFSADLFVNHRIQRQSTNAKIIFEQRGSEDGRE